MEIYHWMLLILFSIPYFGTKIYNEIRYNKSIYWLGMNKAEIILSTLPIILSTLTIRRYEIYDYQYIAYTIMLIAFFIHSAMRYEKVKAIVEDQELEPKIPEKKEKATSLDKEVSFDWSPEGGGGGSGYGTYACAMSNTRPNYYLFYNSQGNISSATDYISSASGDASTDYAKIRVVKQESGFNGTLYNHAYARNKNLDDITILVKKAFPNVKIGYDDGGYDATKAGIVYDMGGGAKLKYTDYLEQWYIWDDKKEIWVQILMNEATMKVLKDITKDGSL